MRHSKRMQNRRPLLLRLLWYVLASTLVASCQRETAVPPAQTTQTVQTTAVTTQDLSKANVDAVIAPTPDEFLERASVGTATGPGGMVIQSKTTFKRNEPIRISMWLKESPSGLRTSAKIYDADDNPVMEESQEMKGAKSVTLTFDTKQLKPGTYRVVGYWGGNVAAEYEVKVTK